MMSDLSMQPGEPRMAVDHVSSLNAVLTRSITANTMLSDPAQLRVPRPLQTQTCG